MARCTISPRMRFSSPNEFVCRDRVEIGLGLPLVAGNQTSKTDRLNSPNLDRFLQFVPSRGYLMIPGSRPLLPPFSPPSFSDERGGTPSSSPRGHEQVATKGCQVLRGFCRQTRFEGVECITCKKRACLGHKPRGV